jgi:hypothetical protein
MERIATLQNEKAHIAKLILDYHSRVIKDIAKYESDIRKLHDDIGQWGSITTVTGYPGKQLCQFVLSAWQKCKAPMNVLPTCLALTPYFVSPLDKQCFYYKVINNLTIALSAILTNRKLMLDESVGKILADTLFIQCHVKDISNLRYELEEKYGQGIWTSLNLTQTLGDRIQVSFKLVGTDYSAMLHLPEAIELGYALSYIGTPDTVPVLRRAKNAFYGKSKLSKYPFLVTLTKMKCEEEFNELISEFSSGNDENVNELITCANIALFYHPEVYELIENTGKTRSDSYIRRNIEIYMKHREEYKREGFPEV